VVNSSADLGKEFQQTASIFPINPIAIEKIVIEVRRRLR
jgi:hypothetical protein